MILDDEKAARVGERIARIKVEKLEEEKNAAIRDMCHIAEAIESCREELSDGEMVKHLKLGRCDVCKGRCHEDKPCKFEWKGE